MTLGVYKVTVAFPKDERYGLTGQIRRSCASIPANLAEGCGRGTDADFARFVHIAMGSASETQYHLLLANDLGFLDGHDYEQLSTETVRVKRMLASLLRRLKADSR